MVNLYFYNSSLKYVGFIFIYSYLFFIDYISNHNDYKEFINIDNEFKLNTYENDITFQNYETNLKPIAFYHPEYNNISFFKYFNSSFKEHIINHEKIYELVDQQVKLAKNHLIYGFAVYYNAFHISNISIISIDAFLNKVKFPFFIIWRNDEIDRIDNNIVDFLLSKIEKFMTSDNYIKFKEKPILSINNPKIFEKEPKLISILREKANKRIGKIFLLYPFKGKLTKINFIRKFNAVYDSSTIDLFEEVTNRPNIIYYSGLFKQ